MKSSPKKFLIIRCGALGDLVYSTSVVDALIYEYGDDIEIDFVCAPGVAKLFDKDDRINQVFILKYKKIPCFLNAMKRNIINHSKIEKYDLLINFESGNQFKGLIEKIRARKKIGYFFTKFDFGESKHMVDLIKSLYKDVVSSEVFKKSNPRLIGEEKDIVKDKFLLPKKYIVISPSNSHNKKSRLNYRAWTHQSWKELIEVLSNDITLVIVGGYGENKFFEPLKPYPTNVIDLVGKTSIPELIGIINGAIATVSTDTGTAHISSSVCTPIFCLIGPTPADETGPYKHRDNKVYIISSNQSCSPCYKTQAMKNCSDNKCMKLISASMVVDSIRLTKLI